MQVFVQLLSGKQLTLEVEGTHSVEEVKAMIEASEGTPPAEQTLLLGEGMGERMEMGMTMADYEIRMETTIRLVPNRGAPPHPSQERMAAAMAELVAMQEGLGQRWVELHRSQEELESKKRALARRHGGGKKLKDRLKLTVGGEHVDTKRSTLCTPFPDSKLDALFSGRWEGALLRDPKNKKPAVVFNFLPNKMRKKWIQENNVKLESAGAEAKDQTTEDPYPVANDKV